MVKRREAELEAEERRRKAHEEWEREREELRRRREEALKTRSLKRIKDRTRTDQQIGIDVSAQIINHLYL